MQISPDIMPCLPSFELHNVLQGVAGCLPACHCHFCHFATPRCVAVCCRVLQCVAGCCKVLQGVHPPVVAILAILQLHCVIINCSVLQRVAACCRFTHLSVCCSAFTYPTLPSLHLATPQCVAAYCSVLHVVHPSVDAIFAILQLHMCCSVLQCVAVCCSVLQSAVVRSTICRCHTGIPECVAVRCIVLQTVAPVLPY